MPDDLNSELHHGHCKAPGCYNRIQFTFTCSRCFGPVTFFDDQGECCALNS